MGLFGSLYQAAWRSRRLLSLVIPPSVLARLRAAVHGAAFQRSVARLDRAQCLRDASRFPYGVNVIGYLHAESGVGEAARSTLRALLAAGIPVSAIDFRTGHPARMREALPDGVGSGERYSVNLVHVNADEVPTVFLELGLLLFQRHRNIAFWNWELPVFPERWAAHARLFHEIWTPSEFVRQAVSRTIRDVPVHSIPFCVQPSGVNAFTRRDLGLPQRGFVFLAAMDALSINERKNPQGALEAFERAFPAGGDDEVFLAVKISNQGARKKELSGLMQRVRRNPRVIEIGRVMTRPEWSALLAHCDAVLSMHRSEGFGLILAEAMAAGKPVVATGWSGNMEFMNEANSFPLRYHLVKIGRSVGPYDAEQEWAEPEADHAVEIMKRLVSDPHLRTGAGEKAAGDIMNMLSPVAIGARMKSLLQATV